VVPLRDPPLAFDNTANVSIGIEGDASTVLIIEENRNQFDRDRTGYGFLLPEEAIGRRVSILLTGSAVLDDPIAPDLAVSEPECTVRESEVPCQLFQGTVADPGVLMSTGRSKTCFDQTRDFAAGADILITGRPRNLYRANWAYQVLVMPRDDAYEFGPLNGLIDDNSEVVPDEFDVPDELIYCREVEAPDGYVIATARPTPLISTDQQAVWVGELDRQATVVLRRENSLLWANAGLLAAGLSFGLFASFFTVWLTERSRD
jgi:hypothetical protein